LKILSKLANITNVKAENIHLNKNKQIILTMSDKIRPEHIMNMLDYNDKWQIVGTKLRIDIADLGLKWIEELKECLKRLGVAKQV
jgi:hypothetical protein